MQPITDFTVASGESRGWLIILASAMTLALAAVTVTMRVYTRAKIIGCFGIDDACAILALVCCSLPPLLLYLLRYTTHVLHHKKPWQRLVSVIIKQVVCPSY
jgi:hypothetical protein